MSSASPSVSAWSPSSPSVPRPRDATLLLDPRDVVTAPGGDSGDGGDTGDSGAGRAPGRRSAGRIALLVAKIIGTVVLAVVALAAADAAYLGQRVQREKVTATVAVSSATSETWVIVGADDKPVMDPDTGLDLGIGNRADVVIVVQVPFDGSDAKILAIPRDVTVRYDAEGHMERLTLRLKPGASALATTLCEGLGIPVDHLIQVTITGLVAMVDTLGGIEVDVERPIRELDYGGSGAIRFEIPEAGPQLLDGNQAFGLVRARQPQYLENGEWVAVSAAEGNEAREKSAKIVIDAFIARVKSMLAHPWTLQQAALAGTAEVTLDEGTTLFDVAGLALRMNGDMTPLPVATMDQEDMAWTSFLDDESLAVLATYGYYPGGCQVAR